VASAEWLNLGSTLDEEFTMDGRRMMTGAVALLAAAIGLEWFVSDADAFGRRWRCCCDEAWTCCDGHVTYYDPCGEPDAAQMSGRGTHDEGWEGYEYSGEPMTAPYGFEEEYYYDESMPGMERPQYETGQRPPRPSTPEPSTAPPTEPQGTEGMRSMEESTDESFDTAPEFDPGVSEPQDIPPAPTPPSPEESETQPN
jgi:hypothetical protein